MLSYGTVFLLSRYKFALRYQRGRVPSHGEEEEEEGEEDGEEEGGKGEGEEEQEQELSSK